MISFKKQIREHYSKALVDSNKYMKMQHYELHQNILMQYYEHHVSLDNIKMYNLEKKDLPTYWTAITREGMVMNRKNTLVPNSVVFSFRHDQVIKCSGFHPEFLKMHMQPKIQDMFKNNNCCVTYVVDTFTYCNSVMYCSENPSKWKCQAETQIFKASLYMQCMNQHIVSLSKDLQKVKNEPVAKNPVSVSSKVSIKPVYNIPAMINISFLEKAKHIFTLREILAYNFTESYEPETKMYKIIKPIMDDASNLHGELMNLIRPHCLASFTGKNSTRTETLSNFCLLFNQIN